jgi:hypothetical protein
VTTGPEWKRLGDLLLRRRIELDPSYKIRRRFCEATSSDPNSWYRMVTDLEKGNRDNYEDGTLVAAEVAYRLRPGSIGRFVSGKTSQLEPLESEPPKPEPVVVKIPEDASPAEIAGLEAVQAILDAQRREIEMLTERQNQYEREMAERIERLERDDRDDGGQRNLA